MPLLPLGFVKSLATKHSIGHQKEALQLRSIPVFINKLLILFLITLDIFHIQANVQNLNCY